jgi:hypothetical protein
MSPSILNESANALVENILIGLGTGLIAGLVAGFYTSLVTSRAIRFHGFISDALRCLNTIEYMSEGTATKVTRGDLKSMQLIAGELIHFDYKKAGIEVMTQHAAILDALTKAEYGQYSVKELEDRIDIARKAIRSTSAGWQLLIPWGRI